MAAEYVPAAFQSPVRVLGGPRVCPGAPRKSLKRVFADPGVVSRRLRFTPPITHDTNRALAAWTERYTRDRRIKGGPTFNARVVFTLTAFNDGDTAVMTTMVPCLSHLEPVVLCEPGEDATLLMRFDVKLGITMAFKNVYYALDFEAVRIFEQLSDAELVVHHVDLMYNREPPNDFLAMLSYKRRLDAWLSREDHTVKLALHVTNVDPELDVAVHEVFAMDGVAWYLDVGESGVFTFWLHNAARENMVVHDDTVRWCPNVDANILVSFFQNPSLRIDRIAFAYTAVNEPNVVVPTTPDYVHA